MLILIGLTSVACLLIVVIQVVSLFIRFRHPSLVSSIAASIFFLAAIVQLSQSIILILNGQSAWLHMGTGALEGIAGIAFLMARSNRIKKEQV